MTKDEIKKALECCISREYGMCKHCPNYDCQHEDCIDDLKRQELELITEQEKEIEQLKAENKRFENNMKNVLEIEKKQAKIDVLNEVKAKSRLNAHIVAVLCMESIIDEMIEELKK